jgi:excisionase family DNA binding protein
MKCFYFRRNIMNTKTRVQRYFGFTEAAAYIGASVSTVRRLAQTGQLRGYRLSGRLIRFDRLELDELVRGSAATAKENTSATA